MCNDGVVSFSSFDYSLSCDSNYISYSNECLVPSFFKYFNSTIQSRGNYVETDSNDNVYVLGTFTGPAVMF